MDILDVLISIFIKENNKGIPLKTNIALIYFSYKLQNLIIKPLLITPTILKKKL